MFAQTRQLMLVGLLAALPATIAAQTADQPATTTAEDPAATAAETAPEMTEAPAAPVEGQIVLQSEDTILADNLIGSRVYSDTGETVGDINDLIINLDGSVEGVVIGVGGFLGLGEKDVAVKMASLSLNTDPEYGNIRLMLSATREDLEAAPAFKTAAEQQFEAEAEQAQQNLQNGVAPTATAPADGTAGN
ncbi:MAG: PRC-barrel domain-containing protein [Paracoccaceae bacterium]